MNRRLRDLAAVRVALERALETHEQVLGNFFLAKFLGFNISYPNDNCCVEFEVQEFLQNPRGSLHGGVMATALDIAMGHLVQRLGGPGATVDLSVQYFRAPQVGRVKCTASVLHRGGRLWFVRAQAEDGDGKLVAAAIATMALQGPEVSRGAKEGAED